MERRGSVRGKHVGEGDAEFVETEAHPALDRTKGRSGPLGDFLESQPAEVVHLDRLALLARQERKGVANADRFDRGRDGLERLLAVGRQSEGDVVQRRILKGAGVATATAID